MIDLAQKGSLSICRPAVSLFPERSRRLRGVAGRLFALVQDGVLKIDIAARYALADAAQAHRDAEAGVNAGPVVLIP